MFNNTIFLNQTLGMNSFNTTQYLSQKVFLISIVILIGLPMLARLIIAASTDSIHKPNFWKIFIVPELLGWIIAVLIIFGFLPFFTSMV